MPSISNDFVSISKIESIKKDIETPIYLTIKKILRNTKKMSSTTVHSDKKLVNTKKIQRDKAIFN